MRESIDISKPRLQFRPYLEDTFCLVFGTQSFGNRFGIPKWAFHVSNRLHRNHIFYSRWGPLDRAAPRALPGEFNFAIVKDGLGTGNGVVGGAAAFVARPPCRRRPGEIDAKHAQLISAFAAATQSGDLNALTQLLASDVRIITDGGGKVRAALNVIDGADHAAQFLVEATRKRPGAWWRDEFTLRFAAVNGLPGLIVDAPEGPVQTAAFEIEGDLIRALYVVRNPEKLRHLARAQHESG